jgi:hypothetical protein
MPSVFLAKLSHLRLAILRALYEEETFPLSALCADLAAVKTVGQSKPSGMFSQAFHGGWQVVS